MQWASSFRFGRPEPAVAPGENLTLQPRVQAVSELPDYRYGYDTGDKWEGGFGVTELLATDYWTLRARSAQLFETNLYARGMLRRLITNEINTGLHLEADPNESMLGMPDDQLADWSEAVEDRFEVWGNDRRLCDFREQKTFGELQAEARLEALIGGDVLAVMVQDQRTRLPRVQHVPGEAVQTPFPVPPNRKIVHGVELDTFGRHVAYYVRQHDGTSRRLPAYGEKSGRRIAWLVYGTEKRHKDVRGKPFLSLMLQSLKELDRFRDATLRKAVVNSFLAMFVERDQDKLPSKSLGGGAVRRGTDKVVDTTGEKRELKVAEYIPGLVVDTLSPGETIKPGSTQGTDQRYGEFEASILQVMAWAYEVPPEILKLAFSNNYSASQAAINEFRIYLDRARKTFSIAYCQPIYTEWLIAEVMQRRVDAPRLLEAWRDRTQYDVFGAWLQSDWTGHIKPSTDPFKLARGIEMQLSMGLTTFDRASRELTGTKFSRNIRQQKRELAQIREAGITLPWEKAAPEPEPEGAEPVEDDDESEED